MISEPLVSIIVPSYNVEKYVGACVDSVLKQEYQNWECILINDGSSDHTLEIIKSFETKDRRFQVFTQENAGLSATRNRGIEISNGVKTQYEYITERIKIDFEKKSLFWISLMENLIDIHENYKINTNGYNLFNDPSKKPEFNTKPFDSFLLKTYRKNIFRRNL